MITLRSLLFIMISAVSLSGSILASTIEKRIKYAIKRADLNKVQLLLNSPEATILKAPDFKPLIEKADDAIAQRSLLYNTAGEKWCMASSFFGTLAGFASLASWLGEKYLIPEPIAAEADQQNEAQSLFEIYDEFANCDPENPELINIKIKLHDALAAKIASFRTGIGLASLAVSSYSLWNNWRAPRRRFNNVQKIKELLTQAFIKKQKKATI